MRTGYWAIGLAAVVAAAVAAVVNVVPASPAPDPVSDDSKSAWTAAQVEQWQKFQDIGNNAGTSLEVSGVLGPWGARPFMKTPAEPTDQSVDRISRRVGRSSGFLTRRNW